MAAARVGPFFKIKFKKPYGTVCSPQPFLKLPSLAEQDPPPKVAAPFGSLLTFGEGLLLLPSVECMLPPGQPTLPSVAPSAQQPLVAPLV